MYVSLYSHVWILLILWSERSICGEMPFNAMPHCILFSCLLPHFRVPLHLKRKPDPKFSRKRKPRRKLLTPIRRHTQPHSPLLGRLRRRNRQWQFPVFLSITNRRRRVHRQQLINLFVNFQSWWVECASDPRDLGVRLSVIYVGFLAGRVVRWDEISGWMNELRKRPTICGNGVMGDVLCDDGMWAVNSWLIAARHRYSLVCCVNDGV